MKLGVITDCFKTDIESSIRTAGELGLAGVQIYATKGEFSPDSLTPSRKAELKKLLTSYGLTVSALCGDMGGCGFESEEGNPERVKKTERIIDLAVEFGTNVVTTHVGVIPADKSDPLYGTLLRALTECGRYARKKGVTLAIETGPEIATTLKAFVEDTDGGVGVNLDPANFVMVTGQDPVEAVRLLKDHIVHTHLKDGKRLMEVDPHIIYGSHAARDVDKLNEAVAGGEKPQYFIETPVGEGDVDFPAYLAALRSIGYDGFLTIERETGADPQADIRKAVAYIEKML